MKIEKLPSGSFRVRKTVNHKTYSVIFNHKPSKKEYESAILEKLTAAPAADQKDTFEQYALDFLKINENILKPSTRRGYQTVLNGIPEDFKIKPLASITNADIQALINVKAKTLSAKSCMNYKGFISSVMAMYRPDFRICVKSPANKHYEKYIPTQEEVNAVLDCCRGTEYEVVFRLLMYGLRRGEACALTLEDLSDDNYITINKAYSQGPDYKWVLMDSPKTDASNRRIQIDDDLAALIRKQGYIYNGSIEYLNPRLQKYQRQLGQPHWRLHDYRAYMATELSAHVPEADVLSVGGWSTPNIMKSAYRKSRYEQNNEIRDKVKEILS